MVVPSALFFITCHMSGHMNVYSNCHKIFQGNVREEEKRQKKKKITLYTWTLLQVYYLHGI